MKRALIIALALLTLVLCACGGTNSESSTPTESSSAQSEAQSNAQSNDESRQGESSEQDEQSDPASVPSETSKPAEQSSRAEETSYPPAETSVTVEYCSYSEYPYFALIGSCSEGATVVATDGENTVECKSWHGKYSARLRCSNKTVTVSVYEKVDGVQKGDTLTTAVTPIMPSSDMWPIVTGKDFRFFFQKMLPDYKQNNLPADWTLNSLTTRIKSRVDSLKNSSPDTEIIYLIAPSSMTVYPELVPDDYIKGTGKSRLDLFIEAARKGGATVIDVRDAFAEHKNDEMPLYTYTDSHWSDYGAYIAYVELFDHIRERFPLAIPRDVDDFDWNPDFYWSGDMSFYLQFPQSAFREYEYYRTPKFDLDASIKAVPRYRAAEYLCYSDGSNGVTAEKKFVTNRKNLPSCIVLRDSYSTQMYDILADRMNVTLYKGMWGYNFNQGQIIEEQPDYVIYILAEWNLDSVING